MPAIEASALTKRFGEVTAVDGLSLSVNCGEIFGLVGPDGAGKTTTLRLLTGVMPATGGSVVILGLDFYADLFNIPRAERDRKAAELLTFSRLDLFANRLAKNLSGGMRQKLALCCALIHQPEVLFLDEPTIGVDPVSRREFWLLVYQLLQQGLTLLVSTPYLDEAERCHQVGLMDHGRLIACDTPAGLRQLLPGSLVEVRGPVPEVASPLARRLPEVLEAQVFGDTLHLMVADLERDLPRLRDGLERLGLPQVQLRPVLPSLEDIFVTLLRQRSEGGTSPR